MATAPTRWPRQGQGAGLGNERPEWWQSCASQPLAWQRCAVLEGEWTRLVSEAGHEWALGKSCIFWGSNLAAFQFALPVYLQK